MNCIEMLSRVPVLLAWILMTVKTSTMAEDCRRVSVDDSLQRALNGLIQSSAVDNGTNCSRVVLPVREHVLSAQLVFPAELGRLELVGSAETGVSVTCSYTTVQNYTWYFSRLISLKLQHIHFHNCPRPLRIDTVSDVEVNNSSFRSAILYVYCYSWCVYTVCVHTYILYSAVFSTHFSIVVH